jgi:hypothetical protein
MSSSPLDYHQTTVQAFIAQLQPRLWNRPITMTKDLHAGDTLDDWPLVNERWNLKRFFDWPPDVFVLTSLLLHRTGAYRAGISPPRDEVWPEAAWPETCRKRAQAWREWLCKSPAARGPDDEHPLAEYIGRIEACYDIPINDLYNVEIVLIDRKKREFKAEIWNLCSCLLELHAIADETMRGVGTLFAPRVSLFSHEKRPAPEGIERIHLQANLMLALRGTLSRIGKHRGIVLPKSRTPQSGVTLRSLSLHLSFHHTEVDVAWRAVPWINVDENTLNILLVPWPYHIRAEAFKPVMGPGASQRLGGAGYFSYDPHFGDDGEGKPFDPAKIVEIVEKAQREAKRVHFIVFPEAALDQRDLDRLKTALESRISPSHMPLVVAGLADHDEEVAFNRVVVSIYYAQRWFDMVQDKHHRWKLDADQISAYSLGGMLSGTRSWWEAIRIPRRRLSFLTSNSWLTLAPLICEDLARLEPISDVIRGVGPTLLVALLLDGPQLTDRWPSRYAGVLADDPGTSVLTLTSLGMCHRSLPARLKSREEAVKIRARSGSTVALWNDQIWRWHPIKIRSKERAALLTVATQWIKEDTFDTRAEAENSAVFAFQSIHIPRQPDPAPQPDGAASTASAKPAATPGADVQAEPVQAGSKSSRGRSGKRALADVTELSLYTFFVDALIDTDRGSEKELLRWIHAAIGLLDEDTGMGAYNGETERELLELLRWSLWHRKENPATMPTAHLFLALHVVTHMVRKARRTVEDASPSATPGHQWGARWRSLVDVAEEAIKTCHARMRADRAGPGEGPEETRSGDGRYSRRLQALEAKATQRAERAHENASEHEHEKASMAPPVLKRQDSGRIMFSAPFAILWAVHNRLSIHRRTRTLLRDDARLLTRIEEILEMNQYNREFREWKEWVSGGGATTGQP